ncbi:pentapeptide repeat-containing protein [Nostoc linckia FACHB-104]|nr:pentapeptide repeat-containing protein [Nostoc linckia FACHB-104]
MANEDHIDLLKKGVDKWNNWRHKNPGIRPNFSSANLSGVNLNGANLSGADLSDAKLLKVDLGGANLSGVSLIRADFGTTTLIQPHVFERFEKAGYQCGANLSRANLSGADLRGANLRQADLSEANLSDAKLSEANLFMCNLSRANLSRTELVRTQALSADFNHAIFTGACIEDWNINGETNLNGTICNYVYLRYYQQERRPYSENENFAPGEFARLFQKTLETVDLIFRNGIDWQAFTYAFRNTQIQNERIQLTVQSIENRGDGVVIIKVNVPLDTDKVKINTEVMRDYEFAHKALEERHRVELSSHKDDEIQRQREYINNLFLLLSQQIGVQKFMAEQPKIQQNFNNKVYGVAGNVEGNQNIYTSEQRQNLAEAAAEIQQLLYQLAQNNLTTTEAFTEAVHQEIRHNPTLKARLQAALKAGGLEALKAIFNHPLFSIPAETIKGWLEAE